MVRVRLEHVSKTYRGSAGVGVPALRDLSLSVPAGELLALVGPSGSGKTTTLRLIAGLEEPTQGQIWLNDQVANDLPASRRDVALVFQNCALYPHLTVFDNLSLGLRLRGVDRKEIAQRVTDMAERLGLAGRLQRRPGALSAGERQRVALGRALIRRPGVLLLDEPLSSLDAPLRAQLRQDLGRLHAQLGMTMIYVTHDQAEALALGQQVAVLHAGVLQQVAPPHVLYRQPANLFVAGFIGSPPMNLIRGWLAQGREGWRFQMEPAGSGEFVLDGFTPPEPALGREPSRLLVLGIRAEHLRLGRPGASVPGQGMAIVERAEFQGAATLVRVRVGLHELAAWWEGEPTVAAGDTVTVAVEAGRALLFDLDTGQALACPASTDR